MILKENQQHNKQHAISPQHVAIIMDGNGRWAKKQSKLPIFGHQAGVKSVRRAISFAVQHKLKALTLYAFSRENWHRPVQDVSALMELFIRLLDSKINILHKHNICLNIIGDIDRFSFRLQELICRAETLTSKNDGLNLNIAANYSGRWDIIKSVKKIAIKIQQGMLRPDQINEEILSRYICMNKLAPVDLVIRTGGEQRISNFLLWQIAYAELFFTKVLWPDFNDIVFESALNAFAQRERRFGRTKPDNYRDT